MDMWYRRTGFNCVVTLLRFHVLQCYCYFSHAHSHRLLLESRVKVMVSESAEAVYIHGECCSRPPHIQTHMDVGEKVQLEHEENENNPRAVAVIKDSIVVGRLPRQSAC